MNEMIKYSHDKWTLKTKYSKGFKVFKAHSSIRLCDWYYIHVWNVGRTLHKIRQDNVEKKPFYA